MCVANASSRVKYWVGYLDLDSCPSLVSWQVAPHILLPRCHTILTHSEKGIEESLEDDPLTSLARESIRHSADKTNYEDADDRFRQCLVFTHTTIRY